MNDENKIAWFSVGAVFLSIWSMFFGFVLMVAAINVGALRHFDTTGLGIMVGMILVFVLLPAFGAWKFFKVSRHLARQRRDRFKNKRAFE